MGHRRLRAAAVLLVVAMAACGGSDDETTAASADGPTTSTTAEADTGQAVPGRSGQSTKGGEFCAALRKQQVTLGEVIPAFVAGKPDAELVNRLDDENEAIADLAPEELRNDVEKILGLTTTIISSFRAGTIDQGLPPEATKLLSSPEFAAASSRVLVYMGDVCGIDPSELAPS